jgi:hypothetical protein
VLYRPRLLVIAILLLMLASLMVVGPSMSLAQGGTTPAWTRAIPLSGVLGGSRYPTLVATDTGQVYAFWGVTTPGQAPVIFVSNYDGLAWSRPVDILIGGPRSIATLDGRNQVHLMLPYESNVSLTTALLQASTSAQGWNGDITLNRSKTGLLGDLITDPRGISHAVWFQDTDTCGKCFSVAYQKFGSVDNTVPTYRILSDAEEQPKRLQLVRSAAGTLYTIWDIPAKEPQKIGIELSLSKNDGESWLDKPLPLAFNEQDILEPYLFIDKENNLVLVYNFGNKDETYYSVSTDEGTTWTDPRPVRGLFASALPTDDDYFAATTDSDGIVHLIAVGRASKVQTDTGLYHVAWDGKEWNNPEQVYRDNSAIVYPAITISNGNRLHVAFTARDLNAPGDDPDASFQVWYATALLDTAAATRIPLPTFTLTFTPTSTPEATAEPTRRPTATLTPLEDDTSAPSASQVNPQFPIIIGIGAVVLLLGAVTIFNTILRRRR